MADMSTAVASGTADRPVITADVPENILKAMGARLDQSLAVGNEGAGVVVKAGASSLRNLKTAQKARRYDIDKEQVVAVIDALRKKHPNLSETRLRHLAADQLGVSYDTIMRRLGKKK